MLTKSRSTGTAIAVHPPQAPARLFWLAALALLATLLLVATPAHAQSVVTFDICATTGTLSMPDGQSVNVLGYAPGDCTNAPTAQVPGPTMVVNAGDTVQVTLHNALGEATALLFPGQALPPDMIGAGAGASAVYEFVASAPGTYLYEAGLLPNAQHQGAMGMYGALVVRPATAGQAYDDPASAYDREVLVVLGEVDPALNNSPAPASFDMRTFKARYWLINGKAYPATDPIPVLAGERVLLRYVNAGLQNHAMGVLGLNQTLIALGGNPLAHSHGMVAESLAPGQSADAIVIIPAGAAPDARFALHDGSLLLNNNGAGAFGGMLTFLVNQDPGGTPTDTTGPATTGVAAAFTAGDLAIAASVSDLGTGDAAIQAADFYIDTPGGVSGVLAASDGTFDSPTEAVGTVVPAASLAGLGTGSHTVYVRGQDAAGNWGSYNLATFALDLAGPATGGLVLSPNPSAGNVDVALSATADDRTTGNSAIAAALYSIDGAPGVPMALNAAAPVAALSATIPQATLAALADGAHAVAIASQDAAGNWGPVANTTLLIDRSGPATADLIVAPNPNNGYLGVSTAQQSVRVDATVSEPGAGAVTSNVKSVEGFIDGVGANGTGFPFTPRDGLYNSPVEGAYVFIPLTTIRLLSEGTHQIYVHGQDVNGNWGPTTAIDLLIDKTKPVMNGVSLAPNPTNGAPTVTLSASASDSASAIARVEWFIGADPGAGNGTVMSGGTASINVSTLAAGTYALTVRARDAAGNWSDNASTNLTVTVGDVIFADSFESGNTSAWSSTTGANVAINTAARMGTGGTYGMAVTLAGNTPGYVTDSRPVNETTFDGRFYFSPNGAVTGSGQQTILAGLNATNGVIFRIQYRRTTTGGGTYQVRMVVARAGGTTTGAWQTIPNAATPIEFVWQSSTTASVSLYTGGVLRQTLTGLNTSANRLEAVRMGPSVGIVAGASGTQYYDAYAAKRSLTPLIGP